MTLEYGCAHSFAWSHRCRPPPLHPAPCSAEVVDVVLPAGRRGRVHRRHRGQGALPRGEEGAGRASRGALWRWRGRGGGHAAAARAWRAGRRGCSSVCRDPATAFCWLVQAKVCCRCSSERAHAPASRSSTSQAPLPASARPPQALLSTDALASTPFLILGNKIDIPRAASDGAWSVRRGARFIQSAAAAAARCGVHTTPPPPPSGPFISGWPA